MDKTTLNQLRKFAAAIKEARDRGANESDTMMYVVKFFEELLGYDSLKGEISKELSIRDRFCDIALKVEGTVRILVEGKAAGIKVLVDKHIEQAENYAANAGIRWVVLTNIIEWKVYHLTWAENEGISHDMAWEANLLDELETDADRLWDKLSLLGRDAVEKGKLDDFWEHKKALGPDSVLRVLFSYPVLMRIRTELNRDAPARLDLEDVFAAVRDVLSKEALIESGEISMPRKKKRKKRISKSEVQLPDDQMVLQATAAPSDDSKTQSVPPPSKS
jgi:hypothetical protein